MSFTKNYWLTRLDRSRWWAVFVCAIVLPWALATPDLDKTLSIARERYGNAGAETVTAWRRRPQWQVRHREMLGYAPVSQGHLSSVAALI